MSHELFNRSSDLKRLRDEGYFVLIKGGFLVMREVPYVNSRKEVLTGTLISSLILAGDQTRKPDTHVVMFDGEYPCNADGSRIEAIAHGSANQNLGHGLSATLSFSNKPERGYTDYYHKMTTYANILSGPAAVLKLESSPRIYCVPEYEEDSVFNYTETASDRGGIGMLSEKLSDECIAIIGLGGTGSYILDMVAKTPVQEIRLFDRDEFLQHNAFRSPGAPTLDELRKVPQKVEYLKAIYSNMHRGINSHSINIDKNNFHMLDGVTFAFLCMDPGEEKRAVVQKLERMGASFIDVGIGLELTDGSLGGILRVTTSTPEKREHVHKGLVPFAGAEEDDIYASNIQVADLNVLNAALAVVKWKKYRGFYRDLEREHQSTFTTDGNTLDNGEIAQCTPSD